MMNFMGSRRGFYEDGGGSKGWSLDNSSNAEDQDDDGNPAAVTTPLRGTTQEFVIESPSTGGGGGGGGDESPDGGGGLGLGIGRGSGSSSSTTHHPHHEMQVVIEREHMFDKVVTPSDVGKLNRLVIPKQHAEKYFPLDSSSNEKGLLLNFEDRNGKPWRFRYSYWNSSQSYVMTKGWSRFVKEKKLDAGDIVSFQRGVGEFAKDRLFIDWRRRPDAPELPPPIPAFSLPGHFSFRPGPGNHQYHHHHHHHHNHPFFLSPPQAREAHLHNNHMVQPNSHHYGSGSVFYLKPALTEGASPIQQLGTVQLQRGGGGGGGYGIEGMPVVHQSHHHHHQMVFDSVPVVQGKAAAKRLRLFGVNMECPISETDVDECEILSTTTTTTLPLPLPLPTIASSHSSYPSLQLRPAYNADHDVINKGKSSMSLDLDI